MTSSWSSRVVEIVENEKLQSRLTLPAYLSPEARDLIKRLLKRHVETRLGAGIEDAAELKVSERVREVHVVTRSY